MLDARDPAVAEPLGRNRGLAAQGLSYALDDLQPLRGPHRHGMQAAWSDMIDRMRIRPRMVNQDGHAILFTSDRWPIEAGSREEIAARLESLQGAIAEEGGRFVFLRPDETVVGFGHLQKETLSTECNSIDRADALRKRIEKACAGLLGRPMRSHTDVVALAEAVPALDGTTPRDAARTAAGRRRVEKMLQQVEMIESRNEEAARFDVGRLRRELGLE